jgi:hypothetical protein
VRRAVYQYSRQHETVEEEGEKRDRVLWTCLKQGLEPVRVIDYLMGLQRLPAIRK